MVVVGAYESDWTSERLNVFRNSTLEVSHGATLLSQNGRIQHGRIGVSEGAVWTTESGIHVGIKNGSQHTMSDGLLSIENGGVVNTDWIMVARWQGVEGPQSGEVRLLNGATLNVNTTAWLHGYGENGTASLHILGGSQMNTDWLVIGASSLGLDEEPTSAANSRVVVGTMSSLNARTLFLTVHEPDSRVSLEVVDGGRVNVDTLGGLWGAETSIQNIQVSSGATLDVRDTMPLRGTTRLATDGGSLSVGRWLQVFDGAHASFTNESKIIAKEIEIGISLWGEDERLRQAGSEITVLSGSSIQLSEILDFYNPLTSENFAHTLVIDDTSSVVVGDAERQIGALVLGDGGRLDVRSTGKIDAALINGGLVWMRDWVIPGGDPNTDAERTWSPRMNVQEYEQKSNGILSIDLRAISEVLPGESLLEIEGHASIAGTLELAFEELPRYGVPVGIMSYASLDGVFDSIEPQWELAPHESLDVNYGDTLLSFVLNNRGDRNGDGEINISDIEQLLEEVRTGSTLAGADLDQSGTVDFGDIAYWVHEVANTYFGDIDLDGEFNSTDLVSLFQSGMYEDGIEANSSWATGDWNADGDFTSSDLILAFQDGGYEQGPRAAVSQVPEPTAGVLSVLAMLGLPYFRRNCVRRVSAR
jgi:hypothetical protein